MKTFPLVIHAPLRGEWFTETSPATRVPSHGTNQFGLRYAFDFIQKDPRDASHDEKARNYFFRGIGLSHYYCYGQPVYAPFDGQVVMVKNHTPDGEYASFAHDQLKAIRHSLFLIHSEMGLKQLPAISF
ncbi:hypothetical protein NRIC_29690 [Enterococcus florum]|uniref:Peptidase M23 domain-containing protein n=1 Tax=Enterococcus florum TaxID=2480627 RepID=A0A4P5PFP9_9ENTE|nr:hypothetical protein [Enterococcus florum]GCF95078.1 hypothetical protein NRIC_29690 [Enterococcus florum]